MIDPSKCHVVARVAGLGNSVSATMPIQYLVDATLRTVLRSPLFAFLLVIRQVCMSSASLTTVLSLFFFFLAPFLRDVAGHSNRSVITTTLLRYCDQDEIAPRGGYKLPPPPPHSKRRDRHGGLASACCCILPPLWKMQIIIFLVWEKKKKKVRMMTTMKTQKQKRT